ncbi:hypothetical protein L9F63_004812, partial [Diploptera punctata]
MVCNTFPGLSKEQRDLCHRYPDVTTSAIQGLQLAVDECQYQFQWDRWNCSTLNTKNGIPHNSVLLQRAENRIIFKMFKFDKSVSYAYPILFQSTSRPSERKFRMLIKPKIEPNLSSC